MTEELRTLEDLRAIRTRQQMIRTALRVHQAGATAPAVRAIYDRLCNERIITAASLAAAVLGLVGTERTPQAVKDVDALLDVIGTIKTKLQKEG